MENVSVLHLRVALLNEEICFMHLRVGRLEGKDYYLSNCGTLWAPHYPRQDLDRTKWGL